MTKLLRTLLALPALCLALTLGACADDLGNYTYHDLADIGITMDTAYTGIVGEQLTIAPALAADDAAAADYVYDWKAIAVTTPADTAIPLATTRNLDYTVRLTPGDYTLVYTVSRRDAGIFYRATASLSVRTPFSQGWLVLSDDAGRARLDMYSDIKDRVYTDLLAGTTPGTWQTPYAISCLPNSAAPDLPFYLLTADGTTRLSDVDFGWKEEYLLRYEMGNAADADVRPTTIAENGPGKLIIAGGKPYYCDNTTGDGLFGSARKNTFDVASYVGFDALSDHYAPAFLMYDVRSRRFVVCAEQFALADILGQTTTSDVSLTALTSFYGFPVSNDEAFSLPAGNKYDLLHMENTRYAPLNDDHGTTYALLAAGSERVVYGFAMGDLVSVRYPDKYGYAYAKVISRDLSACTGITAATHFAFSSLKNYMYYVSGGEVYRVDLTDAVPTAVPQFAVAAGEEVTCFKFYLPTQSANARRAYDLLVGTADAAGNGTLRVYDGWTNEGDFAGAEPAETHTGFGRIKDVILREIITEY